MGIRGLGVSALRVQGSSQIVGVRGGLGDVVFRVWVQGFGGFRVRV